MRSVVLTCGLLTGVAGLGAAVLTTDFERVKPPAAARILDGVSSQDAALVRDFYSAMADIVVRDGQAKEPACKTVGDLRNRHAFALSMAFEKTGMEGKYAGLGQRLDKHLLSAIGETDLPLTPELRESAAKAFLAIK